LTKWNTFYSIIPMPRIARLCAAGYPHHIMDVPCKNKRERPLTI
jgi:hypothetical protein